MPVAALFIAALVSAAQPPGATAGQTATGTARIRGVVTKADSGAPIPRASLRLSAPGRGAREGATDASGRFEFENLPAGRYALTARKPGYVAAGPGQRTPSDASRAFALADGQVLEDLVIHLARGGAVVGRIVDETGEPVVEAYVRALRSGYVQGGRRLSDRQTVQTNDLGQFRLYGLQPGRYYVAAALRTFDLDISDPAEKRPEVIRGATGFAPTFFAGTAIAADAQPVTVRPAEDVPGIDFALRSVRLARLSGVVVDSRGRPAPGNIVMLNPARSDGAVPLEVSIMNVVEVGADGAFALPNVAPGAYRLDVQARSRIEAVGKTGGGVGIPQTADAPEYASLPVSVTGEDIEGIAVRTAKGHRMTGRLVVEGAATGVDILRRIKVWTYDLQAGLGLSVTLTGAGANVQPDGTFEVRGLGGTRAVDVYGLPQGWALKSVRASGDDVTDDGIEMRDDVTDVEVVVTAHPAQISGTLVDQRSRPLPEVAIVVFSEDRRRWTAPPNRYLASQTTGADGSFRISPLPAGIYLIAVVDDLVDGEWAEPENLERLRSTATKITVADGEVKNVTLRR